ncbi:phytanoyl-CoA dioxygenase family protein [Nonomuraea sp. NPDC051941]|uniref:phytanoyl-CoA dioxygenase family protein n=1 Tax=Nonomuraea sp. NPDC051941 TaxID=3364373 RepID=UPI0037C52759
MTIDSRTRVYQDVRTIEPHAFFSRELSGLLEKNGPLAARAATLLEVGPIVLRIDDAIYTLAPAADTISISNGAAGPGAVNVEIGSAPFSDWVQDLRSMLALLVSGDARVSGADSNAALGWDVVLRAMVDGRPMYEPGSVTLTHLDGSPLDVNKSFTPADDDAEMGRFLDQAGFLMLRGWFGADTVAALSEDIDRGLRTARRDDPHRWWAKLDDGTETCVRLKHFDRISEASKSVSESALLQRICRLTGDSLAFPPSWVESLVKPSGVVEGPSEIRWHKDCWQGKHPYFCNGVTIGILLTPSNELTGGFRVMAGSHRTNFPAVDRNIDAIDLPVRLLYGEPGDLTVHLSCTMHETIAPGQGERRLMYSGFSLVDTASGTGVDNRYPIKHSDWSNAVSSAWDVYA